MTQVVFAVLLHFSFVDQYHHHWSSVMAYKRTRRGDSSKMPTSILSLQSLLSTCTKYMWKPLLIFFFFFGGRLCFECYDAVTWVVLPVVKNWSRFPNKFICFDLIFIASNLTWTTNRSFVMDFSLYIHNIFCWIGYVSTMMKNSLDKLEICKMCSFFLILLLRISETAYIHII